MPDSHRYHVVIAVPTMPHYRLRLFELLAENLAREGVKLEVVYGNPNPEQAAKRDLVELAAPVGVKIKNYWLNETVLHQAIFGKALKADLVIVLNANGHPLNFLLCIATKLGGPKLGFWVYNRRSQIHERTVKERIRRCLTRFGTWWFAYTDMARDYLLADGIPNARITTLNNSVDLTRFRADLTAVTAEQLQAFRQLHGIPADAPVGLYCGGLHRDKRLDFFCRAIASIQAARPDFHMLIVGDGSQRAPVLQAAAADARVHYLGPAFGHDKALCFRLARLFLCPGLVGLAILDAFAAGLPLLTTDIPNHSPEIVYLDHERNGLMTSHDVEQYTGAVVDLLDSESRLDSMRQAALASAKSYGIENMAERFAGGILACLNTPIQAFYSRW